jgi:hypothetical protein
MLRCLEDPADELTDLKERPRRVGQHPRIQRALIPGQGEFLAQDASGSAPTASFCCSVNRLNAVPT